MASSQAASAACSRRPTPAPVQELPQVHLLAVVHGRDGTDPVACGATGIPGRSGAVARDAPAAPGTRYMIRPARNPLATAWARSRAPSLRNTRRAWVLTVSSETYRSRAMSALLLP